MIKCDVPGGWKFEFSKKLRALSMHPTGDGEYFVSKKFTNGEFDYWIVADLIDFLDATGELINGYQYAVEVSVVAPSQVDERTMQSFRASMDYSGDNPVETAIELARYGIKAVLCTCYGHSANATLRYAKQIAAMINSVWFGFVLDAPQNRIGSTGWDFIRGDIMAGLNRWREKNG